jgi:hypothetical protein
MSQGHMPPNGNEHVGAIRVLPRTMEVSSEFVALPADNLADLIRDYVVRLEIDPTSTWCKCPWEIHPADVDKPEARQRKRRLDNHPECPTHTREGLIAGFIKWAVDGSK